MILSVIPNKFVHPGVDVIANATGCKGGHGSPAPRGSVVDEIKSSAWLVFSPNLTKGKELKGRSVSTGSFTHLWIKVVEAHGGKTAE